MPIKNAHVHTTTPGARNRLNQTRHAGIDIGNTLRAILRTRHRIARWHRGSMRAMAQIAQRNVAAPPIRKCSNIMGIPAAPALPQLITFNGRWVPDPVWLGELPPFGIINPCRGDPIFHGSLASAATPRAAW